MIMKNKVYIIPDENKILEDEFYREVIKDHLEAFNEFKKKYKLAYNFPPNDSTTPPYVVANDGHLVIKTEEDSGFAVCYIPKTVTDRQVIWLNANKEKLNKYTLVAGFVIKDEIHPQKDSRIKGIENIIKECNKRNMFYEKKEVDNYARQKI